MAFRSPSHTTGVEMNTETIDWEALPDVTDLLEFVEE